MSEGIKGRIVNFDGSWGSGLGTLWVMTADGLQAFHCDNGPTVRALDSAFPGFIADGHMVDNNVIRDQPIEVFDDGITMAGFNVPDEDDPDLPEHLDRNDEGGTAGAQAQADEE